MRIPRPATLFLAVVTMTLTGLIVARVSAQVEDSPTDHPPIIVPSSSVDPSPAPSPKSDDDDDDGFEKVQPRPRDIGDDDDNERDDPGDD